MCSSHSRGNGFLLVQFIAKIVKDKLFIEFWQATKKKLQLFDRELRRNKQ